MLRKSLRYSVTSRGWEWLKAAQCCGREEFRGESDKAFLTTFELFFANQQNLKFINAQFFAQTLGTVSRHWNNPLK
jgi:hypothetical protein